jgi:hypothetical protein
MKEFILAKYWGIVSLLLNLVLGITFYAYSQDQSVMRNSIQKETIERKNADTQIRYDFKNALFNHEKLHAEQNKNQELLIKYLDQRFDDMEKLINNKR